MLLKTINLIMETINALTLSKGYEGENNFNFYHAWGLLGSCVFLFAYRLLFCLVTYSLPLLKRQMKLNPSPTCDNQITGDKI